MTDHEPPRRPRQGDPIEAYLTAIDRTLHRMSRYPLPDGIGVLRVKPNTYPGTMIEADTYGDRTGLWGDGRDWLEYWASLGGYWINLGIAADADGPYINYESQWRKGDPIEHLPDGFYPAFNFHG